MVLVQAAAFFATSFFGTLSQNIFSTALAAEQINTVGMRKFTIFIFADSPYEIQTRLFEI